MKGEIEIAICVSWLNVRTPQPGDVPAIVEIERRLSDTVSSNGSPEVDG
jgi:hypothetical protein